MGLYHAGNRICKKELTMKIREKIFDDCYVLEVFSRDDLRANMQVLYRTDELYELTDGFVIK